jgi:hypothetical protein
MLVGVAGTYPWLLPCVFLQLVFVHILHHSHKGSLEAGAVWQAEERLVLCVQILTLCCCSPRQELSQLRDTQAHCQHQRNAGLCCQKQTTRMTGCVKQSVMCSRDVHALGVLKA